MTLNAFPELICKADDMPRMTCMTCGTLMPNNKTTAVSAWFEIRQYFCQACDIIEEFVVDLST